MYPILFKIGNIEVQSYYVVWTLALSAAMLWTNKRLDKSGLPIGESTSVITWSFAAMLVGARLFEYIWNWRAYFDNPRMLLELEQGGLSEVGAVVAAAAAAFFLCRAKGVSFWIFADTVSPAILLTIAIGRWGCFLNGCCGGPGAPVQLYYSFAAAAILAVVVLAERRIKRVGILTPLGMGLYAASRLFIDPLRFDAADPGIVATKYALFGCIFASMVWGWISCHKISINRC